MYFTDTRSLQSCESMMTKVPHFHPRGGGRYRNPYQYKKEDCDCRYCPHYKSKKNGCSVNECPVLDIRIECGAAFFYEAVKSAFKGVTHQAFNRRLEKYIENIKDGGFMIYLGKAHKTIFESTKEVMESKGVKLTKRFLAALYLLSADKFLWSRMRRNISPNKISFDSVSLSGITPDGYAIWKTVKELYSGEKQISFSELGDHDIVSDKAFELIVQAITIGRHGYAVTKLDGGKTK